MTSPSFSVEIPRDHPGLPRLLEAAKKMPNLRLIEKNGVTAEKRQLAVAEYVEEFFNALRDVLGDALVEDIMLDLGVVETLDPITKLAMTEDLMAMARSSDKDRVTEAIYSALGRKRVVDTDIRPLPPSK